MGKKNNNLEEVIAKTLVPIEEQPYKIPDNWIWTNLSIFSKQLQYGYTETSSSDKIGPHFLRITDIQNNQVNWDDVPYCRITDKDFKKYKVNLHDIVVARTGATTGKSFLVDEEKEAVFASYLIRISLEKELNANFLWNFMQSDSYWSQITSVKKGIAQPGVNAQKLGLLMIPIPPLDEQQRIVNKIESLFSKIDKAKELIEEAREGFEDRKAAILAKAFRGELTIKWRNKYINANEAEPENLSKGSSAENCNFLHEIPDTWKWVELKSICDFKSGYAFKSKDFIDQGIQVIRMGNLYDAELDLTRNPVYLPERYDEELIKRYSVELGDILLTLTGTKYKRDYGNAVLIDVDSKLLLNQRILAITPLNNIKYVYYYLKTETFRDIFFSNETGGVNQGNVSSKFVETIPIPLAPEDEQKEIVHELEKLQEYESKIDELTQLEDQIELLKKSILAKAFRGELGTNDPTEESSLGLLEEVLKDKIK